MVPRLHRYLGGAAGNEVTESFMVAGGNGCGVKYSYDGITWTTSDSGSSIIGISNSVAWNGSMWLACGNYGVGYSLDGINWTASEIKWTDTSDNLQRGFNKVATNGSMWLCCGSSISGEEISALIGYSSDGITWTASESARSVFGVDGGYWAECDQIACNGSMWLASGYNDRGGVSAYSYDGITWTLSGSLFIRCMAWNGIMWVGSLDGDNPLIYSYDGINWNGSANGISLIKNTNHYTSGCMSVATNGSMWVAASSIFDGGNSLVYSYDGINWTASANGNSIFTQTCKSVAWNGTRWVAGGCTHERGQLIGVMAYSTDGITWTSAGLLGYIWYTIASRHVLPYTVPLCKRVTGTNSCVIEDTKYRILE